MIDRVDAAFAEAMDSCAADTLNISVIATTIDGVVVYWNDAAARLYGWSAAEALGRSVVELKAAAQNRAQAEDLMRTLQAGEAWSGEIVLRHRNGVPFTAFVLDVPLGGVAEGAGLIVGASAEARRRKAVVDFQPKLLESLSHYLSPRQVPTPL